MSASGSRHRLTPRVMLWTTLVAMAFVVSGLIVIRQSVPMGGGMAAFGAAVIVVMLLIDLFPSRKKAQVERPENGHATPADADDAAEPA